MGQQINAEILPEALEAMKAMIPKVSCSICETDACNHGASLKVGTIFIFSLMFSLVKLIWILNKECSWDRVENENFLSFISSICVRQMF